MVKMITWKDPRNELPEDGCYVAALQYHNKNCWPLSAEIMFGQVESYINEDGKRIARVNTNDFTGGGSYCWDFPVFGTASSDEISAWAYAKDFTKPDFLHHDPHWGEEKK